MVKKVCSFRLSKETIEAIDRIGEKLNLSNQTDVVIRAIEALSKRIQPHAWAEKRQDTVVIWSHDTDHEFPVEFMKIPTAIYDAFPEPFKAELRNKTARPSLALVYTMLMYERVYPEDEFSFSDEYRKYLAKVQPPPGSDLSF